MDINGLAPRVCQAVADVFAHHCSREPFGALVKAGQWLFAISGG